MKTLAVMLALAAVLAAACSSAPRPPATVAGTPILITPSPPPISTRALIPTASGTATASASATGSATPGTYTVKPGDTLSQIASTLGVSLPAIVAANPTVTPDNIQVGLQLVIPRGSATPSSASATATRTATSATAVSPTPTPTP